MAVYSSLVSGPCSEAEMRCVGGDGRRKSSSGCGGGAIFRAFFAAGAVAVLFVAPQTAFAQDPSGVSAGFEHSCVVTSTGSVKVSLREKERGRMALVCIHAHALSVKCREMD